MRQGEIWQVNLEPVIGAEIKKSRPALVISTDALGKLPLKVIVPVTDWKDQYLNYPWMVKIEPSVQNGLSKLSAIDCFQIRCVSVERLVTLRGTAIPEIVLMVQEAVASVIGAA